MITDEYRRSIHTSSVITSMNSIDTSIALGFYVKSREEFLNLVVDLRSSICCGPGALFSCEDCKPNYESNIGDMDDLLASDEKGRGDRGLDDDDDDDDDFVFV